MHILLQQELVLSELYQYINQDPVPDDAASVKLTLKCLEACNKLFKKGFLSHKKICNLSNEVLHQFILDFHTLQSGTKFYREKV